MNMLDPITSAPAFLNTQMTVVRVNGGGNAGAGLYQVTYLEQGPVTVSSPNSVVSYQLIAPTPAEIVFVGMRTNQDGSHKQFSASTISLDGKLMTFIDCDNWFETIGVTLLWRDGPEISHDPQVVNTPQP